MDRARGVPGGEPAAQVPALRGLVLAGGEEREQVEQPERAAHDAVEPGLADAELLAHHRGLLVVELGQLGLDARRDRDRGGADGGGVVGDDRRHGVVALVDVRDVEHRLAGQRREVAQRGRAPRRAPAPCAPARRAAARRSRRAATPPRRSPPCRRRAPRARRARGGARPARGRRRPARSRSSPCRRAGSTRPSGWITFSSPWQRTTCSSASVSRMLARNWLPSPSPLCAPATSPAMSWKSIVSGTTFDAPTVSRDRVEPRVAHRHDRDVRLDRRERVVRGLGAGARERVEQRGLARVRHARRSRPSSPEAPEHGAERRAGGDVGRVVDAEVEARERPSRARRA